MDVVRNVLVLISTLLSKVDRVKRKVRHLYDRFVHGLSVLLINFSCSLVELHSSIHLFVVEIGCRTLHEIYSFQYNECKSELLTIIFKITYLVSLSTQQ